MNGVGDDHQAGEKSSPTAQVSLVVQPHSPPANAEDNKPKEKHRDVFDWIRLVLEGAAFAILIWGACIASRNLTTLVMQTNLLRDQIHVGQRAYVLVQEVKEGIDLHLVALPQVNQPLFAHYSLKNSGETPAKDVRVFAKMVISPEVPHSRPPTPDPTQSAATLGKDDTTKSWQIGLDSNNGNWSEEDDKLWRKSTPILLLVTVTYESVFAGVEDEQTTYCGFQVGVTDRRFWPCPPPGNTIR